MDSFQQYIKKELKRLVKTEPELEIPPDSKFGDYAFPCFSIAKTMKKSPTLIAEEIVKNFKKSSLIAQVKQAGPYVNFFVNKESLAQEVITNIFKVQKTRQQKDKVMVEFSQANTHKAFHVGHIRGTSLGESLSRILEHQGYKVIRANYQGDTGAHVAKWLWCYFKFHDKETLPKKDGERWIASIYVEAVKKIAENPDLQAEVDEVNKKLEDKSDKQLLNMWKISRQWSLDSLEEIYKELDVHFDKYFFEGEMEDKAKDISKELLKSKIAKVDDGATLVDLDKYELGKWILLRKDGTVLYSSKDLALADIKFKRYKIDKSIYVVGAAQSLHMKQLFKTLELMKFKQAEKCYHLAFTEVRLPTGKMSSRTGDNILYSDLMQEVTDYATAEVEKRHNDWSKNKIMESAKNISVAAIKFSMLNHDPNKNIVFEKEKALDFEGETGPYLQYTHARMNSVITKARTIKEGADLTSLKTDEEKKIIMILSKFDMTLKEAAEHYKPALLCRYLITLCQAFNIFYQNINILNSEEKDARLMLTKATKIVLAKGLFLLGLAAPDKM